MSMDDAIPPHVLERFRELQREYTAELPHKLDELAEAIAARDASQATMLAHRLAGTAGSYGLSQVSCAAGVVEARLLEVATQGWEPVEKALSVLRAK
jgi:HPt (histidine-containing phosphotransfer) domain-containing protein